MVILMGDVTWILTHQARQQAFKNCLFCENSGFTEGYREIRALQPESPTMTRSEVATASPGEGSGKRVSGPHTPGADAAMWSVGRAVSEALRTKGSFCQHCAQDCWSTSPACDCVVFCEFALPVTFARPHPTVSDGPHRPREP